MRSRKQTPPELNGDHVDDASTEADSAAVDALALAEEAEAEAAEAEAVAAAARARAEGPAPAPGSRGGEGDRNRRRADVDEDTDVGGRRGRTPRSSREVRPDVHRQADAEEAQVVDERRSRRRPTMNPRKQRRRLRIPLPSWKAVAATLTVLVIAALLAG